MKYLGWVSPRLCDSLWTWMVFSISLRHEWPRWEYLRLVGFEWETPQRRTR